MSFARRAVPFFRSASAPIVGFSAVGNRSYFPQFVHVSNMQIMTRQVVRHYGPALTGLRLIYPAAYINANGAEIRSLTNLTLSSSVAATVGGARVGQTGLSITTGGAGYIVVDHTIAIAAGPISFEINTWQNSNSGGVLYGCPLRNSLGEGRAQSTTTTPDLTANGAGNVAASGNRGYGPCAILGQTGKGWVVVGGDSLSEGYLSSADANMQNTGSCDANGNFGRYARALDPLSIGHLTWSRPSASLSGTNAGSSAIRYAILNTMDLTKGAWIQSMLRNDMAHAQAVIDADTNTYNSNLGSATGIRIIGATMAPYTTSTDDWVTTANQTLPVGAEVTRRNQYNANVRACNVYTGQTVYIDPDIYARDTVSTDKVRVGPAGESYAGDATGHDHIPTASPTTGTTIPYGTVQIAAGLQSDLNTLLPTLGINA